MWYIGSFFFRLAALPTNWDTRLDLFTNSPDQIETSISSLSMEISFPARKTTLKNIPTKKFTPIIWRMTSDLWCITATRFVWILFVTLVLIFYLKVHVDKKENRLHLIFWFVLSQAFSRDGESKTIVARDTFVQSWMGQRAEPSFLDVKLANEAYQCNSRYW